MLQTTFVRRPFFLIAVALLLAACGGAAGTPSTIPATSYFRTPPRQALRAIDKIKHVVIVVQENRSFNDLFYGFPGAKTATFGYDSKHEKVALKPLGLASTWDLPHNSQGFLEACDGIGSIPGTHCRMDGFDKERPSGCGASGPRCPIKWPQYSYVPH
ncbi:MAG TPA: hypothetical protein VHS56_14605, partial [Candidatus Cybelea sp.]|nr:hypothetical protein [Candidatus Cybelea sp.]